MKEVISLIVETERQIQEEYRLHKKRLEEYVRKEKIKIDEEIEEKKKDIEKEAQLLEVDIRQRAEERARMLAEEARREACLVENIDEALLKEIVKKYLRAYLFQAKD